MRDHEEKVFRNAGDFLAFLDEERKGESWARIPTKEIEAIGIESNAPLLIPSVRAQYELADADDEMVLETMNSTRLLMRYPREGRMTTDVLRYTAFNGIFDRSGSNGSIYDKMPGVNLAIDLNNKLQFATKDCVIYRCGGKISGVLSEKYKEMPRNEVFRICEDTMTNEFPTSEFSEGYVSCTLSSAKWKICGTEGNAIANKYKETMAKYGRSVSDVIPVVIAYSGDCGNCAVHLTEQLRTQDGRNISICSQAVDHVGNTTMENWKKVMDNAYYSFVEGMKGIEKLMDIEIKHPDGCFLALAKKCSIAKSTAYQALEVFQMTRPEKVTGYDLYWGLWECTIIEKEKHTASFMVKLEESISKVMSLNIENFDHDFSWL